MYVQGHGTSSPATSSGGSSRLPEERLHRARRGRGGATAGGGTRRPGEAEARGPDLADRDGCRRREDGARVSVT